MKLDQFYLELLAAWGDHPLDEEEVKNILKKEIQTAVQKERTDVLNQIKDIMIDERFLNRQVIPPYGGTKHDSRERGEIVATERLMLQLKTLINSLTTKDTKD